MKRFNVFILEITIFSLSGNLKESLFEIGLYLPLIVSYAFILAEADFPDKRLFKTNGLGQKVYTSTELSTLWPYGFSTIGEVTEQSAQYVARYTLKKVYGKDKDKHYGNRKPEYVTMSRRPGIGRHWYNRFKNDIYPKGILVQNGVKQMPPKYYDELYKKENPDQLEEIKADRKRRALKVRAYDNINGKEVRVDNNDSFRLKIRENIVL